MEALPAVCPKCSRIFGVANYHERSNSLDNNGIEIVICECGYVSGHPQTNVCR